MKKIKIIFFVVVLGVILLFTPGFFLSNAVINTASANSNLKAINNDSIAKNDTIIELAGHQLSVLKGGMFDRFHSNSPLSVVAQERPDIFKLVQNPS